MPALTQYSFSEKAKQALHIASQIAKENLHEHFSAAHLLKALLHKDLPLLKFLEAKGVDVYYVEEWAEIRIEQYPRSAKVSSEPQADPDTEPLFKEAEHLQTKLHYHDMEPECLFIAIATPGVAFAYEQLKTFPVSSAQVLQWYEAGAASTGAVSGNGIGKTGSNGSLPPSALASFEALGKYCIDKLQQARNNELHEVIGRDKEIRQICEIISRKSKSNVIITGEAGVGKTALLDGFALAVANKHVPQHLQHVSIYQIDNGAMLAGASYKGEIEDRLIKIIRELNNVEKPVLFIDEIHTLIDKNNPNGGVTSILKAELAKGYLTVVGTTTLDEYRKSIEKDETFSRRFEMVKVNEPDITIAEKMLRNQAAYYETHHSLTISDGVFAETIRLSKRFIKERKLPDSALDLLDRTLAVTRMMTDTSKDDVAKLQAKLDALTNETEDDLRWLYHETQTGLSPVLLARYNEEKEFKKILELAEMRSYLTDLLNSLAAVAALEKKEIDPTDISAVVANVTGIPIGKIQTKEQQRLVNMENHLRHRVIGQDHALKTVSDAILESRSGLNKAGQPIASFFFLGPTGTGKTELAKSLAEFLFQDENSIIRFDMSEFKEEHSAALLYGAPPGYVGYEEGGMLVNKIRQQPYAIVLFDEIEKAHPSVFDIFLQILDEGKMHDRLGKEGDFSNAVILFTSNIGAEHIINSFGEGKIPKSDEMMEIMSKYFRPEFLARVTEIIPFAPVSKENVLKIFNIHLKPLVKQLEIQGMSLEVLPDAAEHLAHLGFTPKYGVRPLKGAIRTWLRKPLSRMIINEEIKKGNTVVVGVKEQDGIKELTWEVK
ncbi:ATP-dependent Clp protease ATP-binding subunit [Terrimonas rubra]|uniref:ATP-dependent Clp protease ATP-binding subunit n=1 Tax=Terrimonas rubra TaxID=1035890 RepID=A0ABW6A1F7_9BACT